MSEPLVELDERLVTALRSDPRASMISIAKDIGAPRSLVTSRLRQMFDDGELRVVAALHPEFSGKNVIAHVSVRTHGPIEPVLEMVSERKDAVFVSVTSGAHDFIFEARAETHAQLDELLAEVRARPEVARINSLVYSRVYKGYLEHETLAPIQIDEVDSELLRHLELDGRTSWQDLAEEVGLSGSAVRVRVNRLLDAHLAKIVVVQDRGRLGQVLTSGVGLTLHGSAEDALPEFGRLPFVEFAVSTIGRFDAVMTVRATSAGGLHAAFETLRAHPSVHGFESWTHLKSVKEDPTRRI
ncbi:Lrp/AsnC family transcriptional regulator [Gulosibacter molinativorax]|uniref:Lrp/AsnC family transcriptional regulator n=1 Tax=Gulosibacter molinativorax TaxID=256821 RepID=A0ABT7C9T5_9MICO|nr:Lrp/AsnC family transcriptional regulator [Gulosibacter molinativorax]MDJ1371401.1 Lrp/AsnC family transcriptional regulator [Gulosibacter molinativorax]QUY62899.1 HTH-type transcriptional regulator LrpC [Gulosibacter molinativorax]